MLLLVKKRADRVCFGCELQDKWDPFFHNCDSKDQSLIAKCEEKILLNTKFDNFKPLLCHVDKMGTNGTHIQVGYIWGGTHIIFVCGCTRLMAKIVTFSNHLQPVVLCFSEENQVPNECPLLLVNGNTSSGDSPPTVPPLDNDQSAATSQSSNLSENGSHVQVNGTTSDKSTDANVKVESVEIYKKEKTLGGFEQSFAC